MLGYINSIQSLGTVDGPGLRYVVFLQGCNLRCGCCHNPETWNMNEGNLKDSLEIVNNLKRYKDYFKNNGGITISGGEPLLQAKFVKEVFELSHQEGINNSFTSSFKILPEVSKHVLIPS